MRLIQTILPTETVSFAVSLIYVSGRFHDISFDMTAKSTDYVPGTDHQTEYILEAGMLTTESKVVIPVVEVRHQHRHQHEKRCQKQVLDQAFGRIVVDLDQRGEQRCV